MKQVTDPTQPAHFKTWWIKVYVEMLYDAKVAMLDDEVWRRMVEFFLVAGDYGQDGLLPPVEELHWTLRVAVADIEHALATLAIKGIVEQTEDGWLICAFAKRQGAATAAERQRRHRARKKRVTARDGRVSSLVTDTDSDADPQTEADTEADLAAWHVMLDVMEAFCDMAGKEMPADFNSPSRIDRWVRPVKRMMDLKPDKAAVINAIRHAIDTMRDSQLTIATPGSVLAIAEDKLSGRNGRAPKKKDALAGWRTTDDKS